MKRALIAALAILSALSAASSSFACCSLAPASFSSTKGFASEAIKNGKVVHLLGYQNTAANLSTTSGGNAMLLPIPAKPGTMTKQNILNTKDSGNILNDMKAAIRPISKSAEAPPDLLLGFAAPKYVIFDSDIYTIVLAQDARDIPRALSQVPVAKRPQMNKAIFDAYAKWYPGWTFALCCFNNREAADAKPMLWWYEPSNQNRLFFPALDDHAGTVPPLYARVDVDHALMFSTPSIARLGGRAVRYTDQLNAELKALLPTHVLGEIKEGQMPQGDFSVNLTDLRRGRLNIQRVLPPGANSKRATSMAKPYL